jgi:hypothetical protein
VRCFVVRLFFVLSRCVGGGRLGAVKLTSANSYRTDEERARPRRVPCSPILRRLRDNVHLQQPGERNAWESRWACGVKKQGLGGFMTGPLQKSKSLCVGVV